MARYGAKSGADLMLALRDGVRITPDGLATLSSKNLLPDPVLKEFDPGGRLRYWGDLAAPPTPTGRNVYIGLKGQAQTKQNDSPIRRDRDAYLQMRALIAGGPLSTSKARPEVRQAIPPTLTVPNVSDLAKPVDVGYPAGDYPVSYAWVVGDLKRRAWQFITDPAPPITVTLAQGQSFELPLPKEVPEGVPGMAILVGRPGGLPTALFVQHIIDVSRYVPDTFPMEGPLNLSRRAPSSNETYRGAPLRFPGPRAFRGRGWAKLLPMSADVSFRFRTQFGLSAAQGQTRVTVTKEAGGTFMYLRFPPLPYGTLGIIPQIQAPDGQWYDIDYGLMGGEIPVHGFDAYFTTDDSEKINTGVTYDSGERSNVDETGVPGPDQELEPPRTYGLARLTSGIYIVRTTDTFDEPDGTVLESPPSAPVSKLVGANDALRVDFREQAEEGNIIPNGDYEATKPDGTPRRFSYPTARGANLSVDAQASVVTFSDTTLRATNEDLFLSDPFAITPALVYAVRAMLETTMHASGRIRTEYRFYRADQTTLDVSRNLAALDTAAKNDQTFTFGPAGSGASLELPSTVRYCRVALVAVGNTVGVRNFSGRLLHSGIFRGWTVPYKRHGMNPVPAVEPEDFPYPDGSYMVVVEEPPWTNGMGNGFEYYGTARALARRRYFAQDYRVPVEGNRIYNLSFYYAYEGVTGEGIEVMPLAIRDADGKLVGPAGSFLSGISGSGSGRRTDLVITVPADGAYLEAGPSTLGPGRVRVWGMQLEYGETATVWTDDHSASGKITVSMDTRTPGLADGPLPGIFLPKRWREAGVVAEVPDSTDVTWRARSRMLPSLPWSDWVTDVDLLPLARYVEVEATLLTSDPNVTPEVREIFVQAEPPRPILCAADGAEYPGGVLIDGLPARSYSDNAETFRRKSGRERVVEHFPAQRELSGLSLRTFSDAAAEKMAYDSTHGERLFVAEGYGYRRVIRLMNVRFTPDRKARVAGADHPHVASDLTAVILDEETL